MPLNKETNQTINKLSMMLANFISRTWLHKHIDMFLKIQKVNQLEKKNEK